MKLGKQTIFWLVALVLIAAVVYYFFTPRGAYLEGFASRSDAYPKRTGVREGFAPSTAVPLADGKSAITGLYFIHKGTNLIDSSLNSVLVDLSNVCPVSASTMSKACFDGVVAKLGINKTMEVSPSTSIVAESAKTIISVLNRQLGTGYSTLDAADVGYAMANDADLTGVCAVSATGTITPACYKKIYDKFVTNAKPASTIVKDDLTADEDEDDIKDRRVELFMTLAETVGYDDVKEKKVRNSYDDMTKSCGKKSSSYDRACYEDIAKDLGLTLFSAGSNIGDTTSKSDSTSKSDTSKKSADVSGSTYNAKCTVEFGKDAVTPQTKAATTTTTDTTATTTGDVAKTTKTPAVEQGCEFTQKFPKVNVINLRDYVHKDEIPCWSCKL